MEMLCVSTTEDLWHDFLYFKGRTNALTSPIDAMLRLRYLRGAVSALYAYVEGVVNEWCTELNADPSVGPAALQEYMKRMDCRGAKKPDAIERFNLFIRWACPELKCVFVTECVNKRGHAVVNFDGWDFKKDVRDGYAHPKPGRDVTLFKALSVAHLDNLERSATDWLDNVARVLGLSRHPNTRAIIDDLEKHMETSSGSGSGSDDFMFGSGANQR